MGVPFYSRPGYQTFAQLVSSGCSASTDSCNSQGFNGLTTITRKTNLAFDRSAGGIMIWELSQDATGANSLVSAIYTVIQARQGSTSVPSPGPRRSSLESDSWNPFSNQDPNALGGFIGALIGFALFTAIAVFAVVRRILRRRRESLVVKPSAPDIATHTTTPAASTKPTPGATLPGATIPTPAGATLPTPAGATIPTPAGATTSSTPIRNLPKPKLPPMGDPTASAMAPSTQAPAQPILPLNLSKNGQTLVAKYTYTAADATELSFLEGDKLVIVDEKTSAGNGWFMAHLATKPAACGLVPSNYLG
jgi:hypothetical protein